VEEGDVGIGVLVERAGEEAGEFAGGGGAAGGEVVDVIVGLGVDIEELIGVDAVFAFVAEADHGGEGELFFYQQVPFVDAEGGLFAVHGDDALAATEGGGVIQIDEVGAADAGLDVGQGADLVVGNAVWALGGGVGVVF